MQGNLNNQLNHDQIQKALQDQNSVVIDLRPKGQYTVKHIKGSVNVPLFQKFEMFVAPFLANKKVYFILNQEDMNEAKERLAKVNKGNIQGHLKGGINGWKGTYSQILNISADHFAQTKNQDQVSICDVRFPQELQNGFIKGAKNINLVDMPNTNQIPLNKNTVHYLYCRSGMRSHIACSYLEGLGFNVVSIEGGYEDLCKTNLTKQNSNQQVNYLEIPFENLSQIEIKFLIKLK